MHPPRPLLVVAFAAFAELSSAKTASGQDRFDVLDQCAERASHSEQRECLSGREVQSRVALGEAERRLLEKLQSADQDAALKQIAVRAAQADAKAFVPYASKHCESFAALAFGGNSQADRRMACHIELNYLRAQQISVLTKSVR